MHSAIPDCLLTRIDSPKTLYFLIKSILVLSWSVASMINFSLASRCLILQQTVFVTRWSSFSYETGIIF